eukprot:2223799-Amphidinium_carterae.2
MGSCLTTCFQFSVSLCVCIFKALEGLSTPQTLHTLPLWCATLNDVRVDCGRRLSEVLLACSVEVPDEQKALCPAIPSSLPMPLLEPRAFIRHGLMPCSCRALKGSAPGNP